MSMVDVFRGAEVWRVNFFMDINYIHNVEREK
jgi:hypothetical protein